MDAAKGRTGWIVAAAVVVLIAAFFVLRRGASIQSWDRAFEAIARDDRNAIRAVDRLGASGIADEAIARLNDEDWRIRVAAVRALGASGDRRAIGMIASRASDSDWRVRDAGFRTLSELGRAPLEPAMRDEPVDRRESRVLRWLESEGLGGELCELYAGSRHMLYGAPIAEDCLSCHADEPATGCVDCHADIVATWDAGAHAQSLSHLHLATLNESQQQEWMTFHVPGISCVTCHAPAQEHTCEVGAGPADSDSCVDCHRTTHEQWQQWTTLTPYKKEAWPQPRVRASEHEDPPRSCVSCHMVDGHHGLGARREVDLLKSGLHLDLSVSASTATIELVNLAGHDYPTGTSRRELVVEAWTDVDPDRQVVARLSPTRGGLPGSSPALAPSEIRRLHLQIGSGIVHVRVVYVRDRFDPDRYRVEILRASARPIPGA